LWQKDQLELLETYKTTLNHVRELAAKLSHTDSDELAVAAFRFPEYIWDEFKRILPGHLLPMVKQYGLGWTDEAGERHWIDEKLLQRLL